jgi:F-type H+-transporting ATPase subunit b
MGPLLDAFGIDLSQLLAQLVNFGVLLAALTYFLYKPVMKTLDERRALIAKGVEDAEAAASAAAVASEQAHQTVSAAETEAGQVLTRARAEAQAEKARLEAEAQQRADGIVRDGEARARDAHERTVRESEKEIARLALLAAEKALRTK